MHHAWQIPLVINSIPLPFVFQAKPLALAPCLQVHQFSLLDLMLHTSLRDQHVREISLLSASTATDAIAEGDSNAGDTFALCGYS